MTFLLSKKPPFEKTTSSDHKTKVSFTEKKAWKMFGIFYQNHKLTPWELCKFFNNTKMTFLSSKKPPFWENNIIKRQNQGLFYRKESSKDISNFWQESWLNPFENMESFRQ